MRIFRSDNYTQYIIFMKENIIYKAENFTYKEKQEISYIIKPITLEMINKEMDKLILLGSNNNINNIPARSLLGNKIVDYFTFRERLETKGKYNINFYEFIVNFEDIFQEKKFIKTLVNYYNKKYLNKNKHKYIILKQIYNLSISAINIMKPINCMEIYKKYGCSKILNFCNGWGGTMVGACALNLDSYYGIEINKNLENDLNSMAKFLSNKSSTKVELFFCNALDFDYSTIDYDLVYSSPPYYFKEKYSHNIIYKNKKEMNDLFYKPLFLNSYNGLQNNGYYIINICEEVYNNVLRELLGPPIEILLLKKSKRQNDYKEYIYIWKKTI